MILVLDTETNALFPGQVCQLSYVMADSEQLTTKNFYFMVDEMPAPSQAVHGLSLPVLEELSKGRLFYDDAPEILADLRSADVVIGHNLDFDIRFIRAELSRCSMSYQHRHGLCTMYYFTRAAGLLGRYGKPKPPSLKELAAFFAIDSETIIQWAQEHFGQVRGAHDARYDVSATYLCVVKAIEQGLLRNLLASNKN